MHDGITLQLLNDLEKAANNFPRRRFIIEYDMGRWLVHIKTKPETIDDSINWATGTSENLNQSIMTAIGYAVTEKL